MTDAELLAHDQTQRLLAIEPARSCIVQAPAGAGKTELLTQRLLALLGGVQQPEDIVALTFTNQAAAEMRERVLASLHRAASGQLPDQAHQQITFRLGQAALARDQALGWQLLQHPGRLHITTLDALCARLARHMPLLSQLGSQPRVANDPELYYWQAANQTVAMLHTDHPVAAAIERVLEHFDCDSQRLKKHIVQMLAQRDQWLRHSHGKLQQAQAQAAWQDLIASELANALPDWPADLQRQLMPAARWAASEVLNAQASGQALPQWAAVAALESWQQPLQGHPSEAPLWRALPHLLLTKAGEVRAKLPSDLGFQSPEGKALASAALPVLQALKDSGAAPRLQRLLRLPHPEYDEPELNFIDDLLALLKVAAAQLWLEFQRAGEVDFITIAHNALQALGPADAPTPLQLQLDLRICHLLVDEFQDTSPTQVALLERLMAGWQTGEARSLFLVGDPMQSIYKFRKAHVGLFLSIQQHGLGGWPLQALQLHRNNRSCSEVVDWVNTTFPRVFARHDNPHQGAVRFAPAAATRGTHPLAQVSWHPLIASTDAADDTPAADWPTREAEQILHLIRTSQQQDPNASIAVLVRARTHLHALVNLLRSQQPALAFQAVEIEPLAERPIIQDLSSLTHALHHLGDRVHWLAILRAPWCGLTLADLHALAADAPHQTIWTLLQDEHRLLRLSPDGQQRVQHIKAVIAPALAHQGQLPPHRWVQGVWYALGGPLCLPSPSDLSDSSAFFSALQRCQHEGLLDVAQLPRHIEALYAAPDPTASGQIQLMTIHKSKGLEFDTVILPGLHRKTASADRPLLLWDEVPEATASSTTRLVVAALPPPHLADPNPDTAPTKYGLLHQIEAERTRHEAQRLLYVAVTRAKRQLHLLGTACPQARNNTELATPAKDSLLALLWHNAEPVFLQHWASIGAAHPTPPTHSPAAARATLADYAGQLQRLAHPHTPAALRGPTTTAPPADTPPHAPHSTESPTSPQADVGTLIHRYLDIMARQGLAAWPAERITASAGAMQVWLQQRGHAAAQASQWAHEAMRHLHTSASSTDGQWVLAAHPEARNEWALSQSDAQATSTHVIDRTFVADGVRWIIDYKTTRNAAATAHTYQAQLQRYRALFDPATPVQLAIFFTDSGQLMRLNAAPHAPPLTAAAAAPTTPAPAPANLSPP